MQHSPAPHVLPHTLWTRGVCVPQIALKEEAGNRHLIKDYLLLFNYRNQERRKVNEHRRNTPHSNHLL